MAWGLGIGAGVGLLKNELIDKPRADVNNQLQAKIAMYSPWTHMTPGKIQSPNPFDAALQYGATGALMGRGLKAPNTSVANAGLDTGLSGVAAQAAPTAAGLTMPTLGDSYLGRQNPWSMGGY